MDKQAFHDLRARRTKAQLGFQQAATLERHEHIFRTIASALPESSVHSRPLHDPQITTSQLARVRELVAALPRTNEVVRFLADTKNGLIHHPL